MLYHAKKFFGKALDKAAAGDYNGPNNKIC